MKRVMITRFIPIICVLIIILSEFSYSVQERRVALVIGNGAYKSSPLKNPVNDAADIADALKKCDFTVMKVLNADRKKMRNAIRKFGEEINRGAAGLFYYAGHGIQVDGKNYLVPIGAEVYNEDEVKDECLMVSSVLRKMESAGNQLNIIILDACRDNPFGRSFRSSNRGLAKMDAPTGSILAYATAPGSVAMDGTGRNGLYTSMFLKHMMAPGITLERVFKRVRIDVINTSDKTGKRQTPWESSSLTVDFYFNLKRGISVVERPAEKTPSYNDAAGLDAGRKQLEQERRELERLKIKIERKKLEEELKRLETEKKKLLAKKSPRYASISPDVTKPADIRFISNVNGVVKDTNTGLEWFAGPDRDTTWKEVRSWTKSLSIDGGGWRMPTVEELKNLYQEGVGTCNVTPLLKTTGWFVWSRKTKGWSMAWGFDFGGNNEHYYPRSYSYALRGFAVRSRR